MFLKKNKTVLPARPVVLKVGGIAQLGASGQKRTKRDRGAKQRKGEKMLKQKSIIELTSVAYYYDLLVCCKFQFIMIIVGGCCYSNLSVKFLLWIFCFPGYSADYFHKNSECNISVVLQLLSSAS